MIMDCNRRVFLEQTLAWLASTSILRDGPSAPTLVPSPNQRRPSSRSTEALTPAPEDRCTAEGSRFAVATVHELATQTAKTVFLNGGNAVDAAIAASFTLSVVDGHNSGIGGGCFALVRSPRGEITAIDGREQAGGAATADMYLRNGVPQPTLSQTGPLAPGVPGQVAALELLHQQFGRLSWKALLEPAVQCASDGFVLGRLANVIRSHSQSLQAFPETKRILLPNGTPPAPNDRLVQPELARTLQQIAQDGADFFYKGPIARQICEHLQAAGGILTRDDFASYQAKHREPIETTYRGRKIIGFPPPSSGGIHVAQMLSMLEIFDVNALATRRPELLYHLWLEVMQRAMADRAHWLGDADYAQVPSGLLDADYLLELGQSIRLNQAGQVDQHGMPPHADSQFFGDKHTTHLTTADQEGWVVAMTQTINTSFGSKMIVPGTGIILNNEMDDFSIAPGVANAFGLVGAQANSIAPGKRPLSSMSPTLVLHPDGRPMLTCGAAGGPRIITATLQNVSRVVDLGQDIAQALASPRVHHQWRPAEAVVEERLPEPVRQQLEQLGHNTRTISASATAQGIQWVDGPDGSTRLLAAADPRVDGVAEAG